MHRDLIALSALAEHAARAGGALVRAGAAQRGRAVRHKGPIDLVTETDLASEAAIRGILEAGEPGIPILAEEGGGPWHSPTRWIVDPLDGTTNFVHGFPSYGVSIALELDGAVVLGCVYDPVGDLAYTAVRGGGARCEGAPLAVSSVDALSAALLATGFPYDRAARAAYYLRFVQAFLERSHGVRRAGAASIDFAHVAAGRLDGYWELGLKPWDVAAGALLVAEAGGRVSDMALGPLDLNQPRVLASNGLIHEQMATVLLPLLSSP